MALKESPPLCICLGDWCKTWPKRNMIDAFIPYINANVLAVELNYAKIQYVTDESSIFYFAAQTKSRKIAISVTKDDADTCSNRGVLQSLEETSARNKKRPTVQFFSNQSLCLWTVQNYRIPSSSSDNKVKEIQSLRNYQEIEGLTSFYCVLCYSLNEKGKIITMKRTLPRPALI